MSATTQGELAADLRARTDAADARARALTAGLNAAVLRRAPSDGGWSIGQVFEHLIVSADSYLETLPRIIAAARERRVGEAATVWAPSLMGGWLARSLAPGTRRMPAPKSYRPGPEPRADVVAAFLARQAAFKRAMEDAAEVDWRRVRLGSPVLGLIRINLGDAFLINTVHVERHLGQVERVLAEVRG